MHTNCFRKKQRSYLEFVCTMRYEVKKSIDCVTKYITSEQLST